MEEHKKAILCVDDEVIILLSVIRELKRAFGDKFVYEQATNAETALKVIEELAAEDIKVIFIISDWLMPGMRGDEFLEKIHEMHPEIKAVMITGQADAASIERVKKNSSVVGVFNKPWKSAELIKVIQAHT